MLNYIWIIIQIPGVDAPGAEEVNSRSFSQSARPFDCILTSGRCAYQLEHCMNYTEALEFLRQRGNEVQTMHLGLHRTYAMMRALGNPHHGFPSIHIAGTNGKGSVAAMLESILTRAGYATGLYTSPHLDKVEERMRIAGCQISARHFAALATRIRKTEATLLRKKLLDRRLTTFELLTCCAFLCFAEKRVDIAIIEVGLGGKLDATNVILPQLSIITGVSLDHQYLLGSSLTKITKEKAGIIKEGVPVISGCSDSAARRVVHLQSKKTGAPLLELDQDCSIRARRNRSGHYSMDLATPRRAYRDLRISLRGEIQTRNAALAVMASEALQSFETTVQDIRYGIAHTVWPGRLDIYKSRRRTLLDGAHNLEAARLLQKFLKEQKETEVHLVFGVVRDKNIREIGKCLFPIATTIHLTLLANSRSADPREIAELHENFRTRMRLHSQMHQALYSAWRECSSSGLVVVTGSLYLVGELLRIVRKHRRPVPAI